MLVTINIFKTDIVRINQGLHSCKNIKRAKEIKSYRQKIVTMYIPKGALYYEHEGYYVSNRLTWY